MDPDVELSDSSGSESSDFESEGSDLADMNDEIALGHHPNPTARDNVILLAVECVSYYMNWNNLVWVPPVDTEDLRMRVQYEYFTRSIGKALVEQCMVPQALQLANLTNLDVDQWLEMSDEDAGDHVKRQFTEYFFILPPYLLEQFRHIYVWGFACYLCFRAVQNNRRDFSYHILDRLIDAACSHTTASQYYSYLNIKALLYNSLHQLMHGGSEDEGYDLLSEDVRDLI